MIYIGIDPGVNGGLAAIYPNGSVSFSRMPPSDGAVWEWLAPFRVEGVDSVALIEKVQGHIGRKRTNKEGKEEVGHPGSAMFKFGQSYGALRMALLASGIGPAIRRGWEVTPQEWQRGLEISPREAGLGRGHWKKHLKRAAQRLFPRLKVTLKTADALLIAEWCRRVYLGDALGEISRAVGGIVR